MDGSLLMWSDSDDDKEGSLTHEEPTTDGGYAESANGRPRGPPTDDMQHHYQYNSSRNNIFTPPVRRHMSFSSDVSGVDTLLSPPNGYPSARSSSNGDGYNQYSYNQNYSSAYLPSPSGSWMQSPGSLAPGQNFFNAPASYHQTQFAPACASPSFDIDRLVRTSVQSAVEQMMKHVLPSLLNGVLASTGTQAQLTPGNSRVESACKDEHQAGAAVGKYKAEKMQYHRKEDTFVVPGKIESKTQLQTNLLTIDEEFDGAGANALFASKVHQLLSLRNVKGWCITS